MATPFQPTHFGRYLLTERIAIGGMAEIFYAKVVGAMGFEKPVVIKRILPQFAEDTDFLRMFITEAKLVCHLEHPNIVQVHELGEINGQYFIAMEYINGIDARKLWRTLAKRRQRLPGVLAMFIVGEFLKGLDFAHRALGSDGQLLGVVHRDVSPSNILISYRGDIKIGDFGIALVQQESKTQAGVLKGKFGYMSPEQVAGLKVDHRSDIFAAGIVLAELLLGRRLFLGSSEFITLDKVMNVRLDVLEQHEKALPPQAVAIVKQALQRDKHDRYQSAREFYEELSEYLYKQEHRITNETLAAFIAEHVTPYLERSPDKTVSPSDMHTPRSSSDVIGLPIVSNKIIPGDEELVPPSPERKSPDANLPQEPKPVAPKNPSSLSFQVASSQTIVGVGELSQPSSLDATPGSVSLGLDSNSQATDQPPPEAHTIDASAFASIPMLEMPLEEDTAADLDLAKIQPLQSLDSHVEVHEHFFDPSGDSAGRSVENLEENPFDEQDSVGELNLDEVNEEEEIFVNPEEISQLSASEQSCILVQKRLDIASTTQGRGQADFQGSLTTRTVTKVLFRFGIVKETGLLVFTGPPAQNSQAELLEWLHKLQPQRAAEEYTNRTCEIHLVEGDPHLISADRSDEALIAYLIEKGELDQNKVENAVKTFSHRRPVAALLEGGAINPLQVSRQVTSFVQDTILDSFAWNEGSFGFFRNHISSAESFPLEMTVFELINEGLQRMGDTFFDRYFKPFLGTLIMLNQAPSIRFEAFEPDELQLQIFQSLATPKPLVEVLTTWTNVGNPIEVKRTLYFLVECELAELHLQDQDVDVD